MSIFLTCGSFVLLFVLVHVPFYSNQEEVHMMALQTVLKLLTKCEVKMAGYSPSSFLQCMFMDRDRDEVHSVMQK